MLGKAKVADPAVGNCMLCRRRGQAAKAASHKMADVKATLIAELIDFRREVSVHEVGASSCSKSRGGLSGMHDLYDVLTLCCCCACRPGGGQTHRYFELTRKMIIQVRCARSTLLCT